MARRQEQIEDEVRYLRRAQSGETSAPYQPRQWPDLEVSDDFAGDGEEVDSEDDDAGN